MSANLAVTSDHPSADMDSPEIDLRLIHRVRDFLYQEAWLADHHQYDDWLALWAKDALYWVPCNDDDANPQTHVAIIHDNRIGLEDRVARLKSGHALAQQPRSRLSRTVANVRVVADDGELLEVRSVCTITAFRSGVFETFTGHVVHLLRPVSGVVRFEILRKTVFLVNNDGIIGNLTFLV